VYIAALVGYFVLPLFDLSIASVSSLVIASIILHSPVLAIPRHAEIRG
jgi:hypothetical protein